MEVLPAVDQLIAGPRISLVNLEDFVFEIAHSCEGVECLE